MTALSLYTADQIHTCSSKMDLQTFLIPYPECAQFCILLEQFERQVRQEEGEENEYWSFFFRRLRRCRFELCAAPLPASYLKRRAEELQYELGQHLTYCAAQYPAWSARAQDLLERAILLLQKTTLPLLTAIETLVANSGIDGTAVLIKDARLLAATQQALHFCENLRGIEVVSLADLRGWVCYERLIMVGPPRWFPNYVFAAPRAREIDVLVYDWIRDTLKLEPAFVRSTGGKTTGWRQMGLTLGRYGSGAATEISAQDLLPQAQFGDLVRGTGSRPGEGESHEEIDARGFLLEGDWAVFLEGDAKASTLVIDVTADAGESVRRIPISEIEPGMFVLLRTSGGGDYIVPLADEILGPDAQQVREYQKQWKARLRSVVAARGLFAASIRLLDEGSTRANEMNVRNWMSPRNIRTWDYEDFLAIMRVIGLESEAEEYWSAMGKIVKAHHRAGKQIRDALLDQVRQTDLRKLERLGQMEFELPGTESGSLTAYRVEAVLQDLVSVRWNRIGRPFQVGK